MKTQIFSNSKSVTPRPFLFIAEHGKGFLPDAIQVFEEAEKIREHEFIKGEIIYNHIAGLFPNEKGELTIYQSGINGFQPTPWIGSDYEQGKVDFIFLDLVIPLTEI
jgi:hypothetical protein